MAHVLIPTDLSTNSLNAAVYAIHLYGEEGNTFSLVNTYMLPISMADTTPMDMDVLALASAEGLDRFAAQLREALPDHTPRISVHSHPGDVADVLSDLEGATPKPDLVVMGTQGHSGLERILLGSNTASVIKNLRTPVLAVPEQTRYTPPRRIVLADDGGRVDKATLKVLLDIARWSKAEVMIVHVVPEDRTSEDDLSSTGYDLLLGAIPHSYHSVSGDNVMIALHDLADQSDTDMVVVLHRHRGIFEQLFHRSVSTRLAMHTHIPMLVLQQGTA
ncbi:MAG: universal stress protein [Flavobacteriales bacterium]|nr:universal stress protein [Flavobacteriales bacterium]